MKEIWVILTVISTNLIVLIRITSSQAVLLQKFKYFNALEAQIVSENSAYAYDQNSSHLSSWLSFVEDNEKGGFKRLPVGTIFMLGAPTTPLNAVYRGNTRLWNREIVCFNGGTSHHEGTCHGCVISLGHKMESDCVCVCAHMGVGGGRKTERKREGKRERLSPCQSGDWGQTCIIRFTMTRCYYSIFHVLTLSVQTYTQEDSNPTHSALLSNKSTQTSTLILTESETIPCLT